MSLQVSFWKSWQITQLCQSLWWPRPGHLWSSIFSTQDCCCCSNRIGVTTWLPFFFCECFGSRHLSFTTCGNSSRSVVATWKTDVNEVRTCHGARASAVTSVTSVWPGSTDVTGQMVSQVPCSTVSLYAVFGPYVCLLEFSLMTVPNVSCFLCWNYIERMKQERSRVLLLPF